MAFWKSEAEGIMLAAIGFAFAATCLGVGCFGAVAAVWERDAILVGAGLMAGLSMGVLAIVRQRRWWNNYYGCDLWSRE